jgi:replicative DNA helicase
MNDNFPKRVKPSNYTQRGLEHGMVPPQASDLEEAVLGAIMLESECIEDVMLIVQSKAFYRIEHQHVFSAMEELYKASSGIDLLTVTQQCKKNGTLDVVGGPFFISELTDRVASSANVEYHARIIQQKFIQRELIRVSGDIYHEAFEDTTDALELLDKANNNIADVGSDIGLGSKSKSNKELAGDVISDAERASAGSEIVGTPTMVPEVDKLTGGAEGGKLYILAARPGMGKSAKALQDAYHAAVNLQEPTVFFSLEMTAKELMLRLISLRTGIDSWKIKNGKLSTDEWAKINESVQGIIDSPLEIIDDTYALTEIRKKCILKKKKDGLKNIFIDYLQLITNKENRGNREQEISEISRTLKSVAKLVDCPIVALAQLSRAVETRGGTKRPMLSDLRESGSLEQDADVVMFLYRPEYYGLDVSEEFGGSTDGLTECIIAKNRGGSTGTAPMRFTKETTSFSPWEETSHFGSAAPLPDVIRSPMPRSEEFDDLDEPYEDAF